MSTIRVPDDTFRQLVDALGRWTWPVTAAEATRRLEQELGWVPWLPRRFRTGLPVDPDRAVLVMAAGGDEVAYVEVAITDWSENSGADRDATQKAAFAHFADLLSQWFGVDGTPLPFPRDHDAAYWGLPSGGWFVLRVGQANGRLHLVDPHWLT